MRDKGNEQRQHRRFAVENVQGTIIYAADLKILNISIDGVSIETSQRLVIDREYALRWQVVDGRINIRGKVVWSTLIHSKNERGEIIPVYRAGLQFTSILGDEATILASFIEKNRSEHLEKRVMGVRFKVHQPDSAMIQAPFNYEIRKISMSGMLISAETSFPVDTLHDLSIDISGMTLSAQGRIANCVEVREGEFMTHAVGIEFMSMPDDDRLRLSAFLEEVERRGGA